MQSKWSLSDNCLCCPATINPTLQVSYFSLCILQAFGIQEKENSLAAANPKQRICTTNVSKSTNGSFYSSDSGGKEWECRYRIVFPGCASGTKHLPYHLTEQWGRKKRWMWHQQAQMDYYHREASCSLLPCDRKRIRSVKAEQPSLMSSAAAPLSG